MLEIIEGLPGNVAAFKATGKVTKKEYEQVMVPAIDDMARKNAHLNLLMVIETDVSHITAGAWMDDILMGFKHFTKWQRVAVVSHQAGVQKFISIFGRFAPGTYRGFSVADLEVAKHWVSSDRVSF